MVEEILAGNIEQDAARRAYAVKLRGVVQRFARSRGLEIVDGGDSSDYIEWRQGTDSVCFGRGVGRDSFVRSGQLWRQVALALYPASHSLSIFAMAGSDWNGEQRGQVFLITTYHIDDLTLENDAYRQLFLNSLQVAWRTAESIGADELIPTVAWTDVVQTLHNTACWMWLRHRSDRQTMRAPTTLAK